MDPSPKYTSDPFPVLNPLRVAREIADARSAIALLLVGHGDQESGRRQIAARPTTAIGQQWCAGGLHQRVAAADGAAIGGKMNDDKLL